MSEYIHHFLIFIFISIYIHLSPSQLQLQLQLQLAVLYSVIPLTISTLSQFSKALIDAGHTNCLLTLYPLTAIAILLLLRRYTA